MEAKMTYVSTDFAAAAKVVNFADYFTAEPVLLIRDERPGDLRAREGLLDAAFGSARREKTSERLREGRLPAAGLALSAVDDGMLVGTLRLWHVEIGAACPALLLGPLAVAATHRSQRLGTKLICEALFRALASGHDAVLLVGDLAYYERFGFRRGLTSAMDLPGPVDRDRFLGLELQHGALRGARGLVSASGTFASAALPLAA